VVVANRLKHQRSGLVHARLRRLLARRLSLLASPSPHQTGTDFLESFIGYLLVSGNSYVEAVALNGELRELYALRPDRLTVLPGLSGWPEGYEYTAAGGTARFTADVVPGVRLILHMRLFHPVIAKRCCASTTTTTA
jgi:phage portal protein BeeE